MEEKRLEVRGWRLGLSSRDAMHRTAPVKLAVPVGRNKFRAVPAGIFPVPRNSQRATRNAITLIEILISLFVLLFGLMGVAAIFPVASHYLVQGDQKDRSDALASNAFAEIKARGLMDSHKWLYGAPPPTTSQATNPFQFIQTATAVSPGYFGIPISAIPSDPHPGFAFVIDPLGTAAAIVGTIPGADVFPYGALNLSPLNPFAVPGNRFPVRRITLPVIDPNFAYAFPDNVLPMTIPTAETLFRLRDDLAVQLPNQGDRPAMQRWSVDNATGNLLARQYQGDYSWLATVVPVDNNSLVGLQPAANLDGGLYDVSVVVFYKRDTVPSASAAGSPGSERLIAAEFLNQGELAIYDGQNNYPDVVDLALDGIRSTNWICVMGVNQTNGQFMMRWYRILALEEDVNQLNLPGAGTQNTRTLMVSEGGDWPFDSMQNLQVAILPGAIHVQKRQMHLSCECCE